MADDIQTAFSLLLIGMLTVFAVLAIIVGIGKLLILSLNRLAGGSESGQVAPAFVRKSSHELRTSKIAAIAAAVEFITDGEGRIRNIERIES